MRFSSTREALLRPLQLVSGVVERQHTMAILSNIHLQAGAESGLVLTGTDMTMELAASLDDVTVDREGEATVAAHTLASIWRALPEGADVLVEFVKDQVVVRSGKNRFSLNVLPANEYPKEEPLDGELSFSVDSIEAIEIIDKVVFSMAQKDVRHFLNGMLLEVAGEYVRSVSTDGHRLAKYTFDKAVHTTETVRAIVSRKSVIELRRLLDGESGPVQFLMSSNRMSVTRGRYKLTTRLIEGNYPDYDKVIPTESAVTMTCQRDVLDQALQRARSLIEDQFPNVRLKLATEQLTVLAKSGSNDEASIEVPVDYKGEPMELGFNAAYLQDVLRALDGDTVRVTMASIDSSARIGADGHENAVYVVMPVKI